MIPALPQALNAGEKEGIAICLNRAGNKFLTNDKRAHNFCVANDTLTRYREIILQIINEYASHKPSHGQIQTEAIGDPEKDHYEVMHIWF